MPPQALIHALLDFDGGVLVISHDEHLVTSICEDLWVAEPGKVITTHGILIACFLDAVPAPFRAIAQASLRELCCR